MDRQSRLPAVTWAVSDLPALRQGELIKARLRFTSAEVCRVEVTVDQGVEAAGEAQDLFEALVVVRRALERQGILLGCNGCRRDVYPSPMLRQSARGRRAYVLTLPRNIAKPPTVDIFEAAPDLRSVVTVDEQRKWFDRWRPAVGPPEDDVPA